MDDLPLRRGRVLIQTGVSGRVVGVVILLIGQVYVDHGFGLQFLGVPGEVLGGNRLLGALDGRLHAGVALTE